LLRWIHRIVGIGRHLNGRVTLLDEALERVAVRQSDLRSRWRFMRDYGDRFRHIDRVDAGLRRQWIGGVRDSGPVPGPSEPKWIPVRVVDPRGIAVVDQGLDGLWARHHAGEIIRRNIRCPPTANEKGAGSEEGEAAKDSPGD